MIKIRTEKLTFSSLKTKTGIIGLHVEATVISKATQF
jgi:hypothetical protein